MINEAKYRSPKWLRNFVDYEINTGEDIKGEPSKRRAAKLEKEKQAELKRQADERQKSRERQEKAEKERKEQEDRYKAWRKQADEKEEQDKIERDLNTLYKSIISDFSANPYSDKIVTPIINGENACNYRFENGKIIKFYKKANDSRHCLEWGDTIYTLGSVWTSKFIDLINEMIDKGHTRPQKSGYDRYNSYGGSSSSSGYKSSGSTGTGSGPKKDNTTGHPKGNLYNTLKQTIKQREEQLSKMSKQDPSRAALENELATAKRKVAEMKTKYKFENLKSFEDFN
jgi:hypothetical protein